MMINEALKTVLRIDNEACAHPCEEGGPGEHGAALGGPGLQVPGVSALPDHQDELVTPEIQGGHIPPRVFEAQKNLLNRYGSQKLQVGQIVFGH